MWVFTRYGFYSVGVSGDKSFVIRARLESHLTGLVQRFHGCLGGFAAIIELPEADYRWRIVVPRRNWLACLVEMQGEQEYANFKAEAERYAGGRTEYTEALHRVWVEMQHLQNVERLREQSLVDADFWPPPEDNNLPAAPKRRPKKRGKQRASKSVTNRKLLRDRRA